MGAVTMTEAIMNIVRQLKSFDRQAMYVQRNTEARSCNHCCSGKKMYYIF